MIEEEGWILVVLLRLAPIVPWNLLNIGMATTRIHFVSFTVASAIGEGLMGYLRYQRFKYYRYACQKYSGHRTIR